MIDPQGDSSTVANGSAVKSYRNALLWLLVAGVIVRVLVWRLFAGSEIHIADAQDYDRLAVGLVETGNYLTRSGKLSSLRPPFYPWLLSLCYQIFGVQNYEAVRLVQSGLNLVNVVIVYDLGRRVFSSHVGFVAAALFCFYPTTLGFNNLLLSETLFTLLVTVSLWLIAMSVDRASLRWLIPAGLALGLGALTRSILWLSTPLVCLLLLTAWPGSWMKRSMAAGMLFGAFAMTIAPWAYRNTKIQKTFTLIDVMGGRNVMMGNYEYTPLERSWSTVGIARGEQSWFKVLVKENGRLAGLTQGQIDKLAMRHGIRFMLSHPLVTAQRTLVRFFNFWQLDRTLAAGLHLGYWGSMSSRATVLTAAVLMGYYALLAYFGIFGVVFAQPNQVLLHRLLLLNILFPCLVHSAIFAHSRYHLAVMPCVIIYSAYALLAIRDNLGAFAHQRLKVALAVIVCSALSLGWIREIVMVDFAAVVMAA